MNEASQKLIRYGHLVAMLHTLVKKKALTVEEAQGIKKFIRKKYRIISEYTA